MKFADDIDLLDMTYDRLHNQLIMLDTESKKYGMQIHIDKAKTLVFRRKEAKATDRLKQNGKELEDVDNFVYLARSKKDMEQ